MVRLNQVLDGSLLSRARLMQAREQYAPSDGPMSPEREFARWTERLSVQSELAGAREIAGLSDAELAAMEAEFARCPIRPRSPWLRAALPAGIAFAVLGALGIVLHGLPGSAVAGAHALVQGISAATLLLGLVVLSVWVLSAFSSLHLELWYGTTGLYFGRLDEQHPWLLKTMSLTHHPVAEQYRQQVLRERGWLRGVDFLMMQELVRAQHALEQTRPARAVAEQLQLLPAPTPAPARARRRPQQPRLVHAAASGEVEPKLSLLK